jgi:hypothetical protein
MLMPSKVEVPRPISSRISRLSFVALLQDVRHLGHLHHERGLPRRKVVRSAHARVDAVHNADLRRAAGTKQPICAIMTMTATCRIYVDLPAMFGPVMIDTRFWFGSISRSFGTKARCPSAAPRPPDDGCPLNTACPFAVMVGRV